MGNVGLVCDNDAYIVLLFPRSVFLWSDENDSGVLYSRLEFIY